MRKVAILITVVILMVAVLAVPMAGAAPEAGKGCYCHKMNGQAAGDALLGAHVKSGGANSRARPMPNCAACH